MEQDFSEKLKDFFEQLGQNRKMVLATSLDDIVSVRMMSIIIQNGRFYFQTDKTFRKYKQISGNGNVALCIDNVQIEGICREIGIPTNHIDFCQKFEAAFQSSFNAYTKLRNERLFEVEPRFIQRWIYEDGKPYVERLNLKTNAYQKQAYIGE